jgi:hypothetical protein
VLLRLSLLHMSDFGCNYRFRGKPLDTNPFMTWILILATDDIVHSQTKAKSPQTNDIITSELAGTSASRGVRV